MKKESERELERRPDDVFEDQDFVWPVTPSGHVWETLPAQPGMRLMRFRRVLTDRVRVIFLYAPRDAIWYRPLLEAGLFRSLADTPVTEDGIREFADRWGQLVRGHVESFSVPGKKRPVRGWVTSFDSWELTILNLRLAVRLWDLISSGDVVELAKVVRWDAAPSVRSWRLFVAEPHLYMNQLIDPPPGMDLGPGDLLAAARVALQTNINHRLYGGVSAQLRWSADKGAHVFRIVPRDLHAAVWLQFARAVAGEVLYRPCKVCGKWLMISAEEHGFRSNREFCSSACRQRDHRTKVREASRLRTEGKTVRQLAKHFDTTTKTIQNWLRREK
jgi:hypothetical protein